MTVRPSGANRAKSAKPRRKVSCLNVGCGFSHNGRPTSTPRATQAPAAATPPTRRSHRRRRAGATGAATDWLPDAEGLERERHVPRRLEAVLSLLLEAVADDAVEPRRHLQLRRELLRLLLQDRVQRLDRRVPVERPAARQHLVEHRPEREDVGAVVRGLAPRLLRRHVADRPQHHARPRVPRQGGRSRVLALATTACSARPKSRILTTPSFVTNRFSGFRSRWTTALSCAAASPCAACSA